MVFNVILNISSVISWWSVSMVEEIEGTGKNTDEIYYKTSLMDQNLTS
jgi:hypothetical protein